MCFSSFLSDPVPLISVSGDIPGEVDSLHRILGSRQRGCLITHRESSFGESQLILGSSRPVVQHPMGSRRQHR